MSGAKLKAFYTLGELAGMAGVSRWRLKRALEANGVPIRPQGRSKVVYLTALKRCLPDIWESILDRLAAAETL